MMLGMSSTDWTIKLCFTIGRDTPIMSVSWKKSVPVAQLGTLPLMTTMGIESM